MRFTKMQGTGNDFVFVNLFDEQIKDPSGLAALVCNRRFGVGADGLVLIGPSSSADFRMDILNADGSVAKMCGNAARCALGFARDAGLTREESITLETLSGVRQINGMFEEGRLDAVTVTMGPPVFAPKRIPALFEGERVVAQPLAVGGQSWAVTLVSMGNPHCVVFVDTDPAALDLPQLGPLFERHPAFPDGMNTEFARQEDAGFAMRVWERGVGETLACGTGACAVAAAAVQNGRAKKDSDLLIRLRGGDLTVRWDTASGGLLMTGPAKTVYTGEWPDETALV
jgi:diaminopimelate epimerase